MTFNLPKYVFLVNGRFVYRPYIPKRIRDKIPADKYGRLKPPKRLGSCSDSEAVILRAYLSAKAGIDNLCCDKGTLFWLSTQYLSSKRFAKLQVITQKDYEQKIKQLLSYPISINKKSASVGDIYIVNLTQPFLRNLLDSILASYEERGFSGRSIVNGQFRVLSAMITYGMQYIDDLGLMSNPCKGIELHKEFVRNRYVTDHEYRIQYDFTVEHGADYLPVFFEHAYLLASRSVEIRDLQVSSVCDEGYVVVRRKGSKTNIILWSARLRSAYYDAMTLRASRPSLSDYLITNASGHQITRSALKSAMARLKRQMISAGLDEVFWNLHDLKRKGVSDATDDRIAGHKTDSMRLRYNLNLEKFEPPR